MKAKFNLTVWALSLVMVLASVACSKSSDNSGGATAAAVLSVTPNPVSVGTSQSTQIIPTGGTPPYTFSLQTGIGGSLSTMTGTSTLFTAGTTPGLAQLTVTDSANASIFVAITVTSSTSGGLTVTPMNTSVAPGATVTYLVTGGTAPYTYTVVSGGGSFSGATFTAPATAATVYIQVTDSASNTVTGITVTVTGTATNSCSGSFTLNLDGYPGTMQIIEDSSGNIGGYMALNGYGYPSYISGTCANGAINFVDSYSGSAYTGTYGTLSTTGKLVLSGTFVEAGSSYPWYATQ